MDSGSGQEDLQGQSSSWNSGWGWSFEVIDFLGAVWMGLRVLGCPEARCTAGPGLSGQPRFLASTTPACGVAEEVLEGRAGWALEPQLPVWWAAKLLLGSF